MRHGGWAEWAAWFVVAVGLCALMGYVVSVFAGSFLNG